MNARMFKALPLALLLTSTPLLAQEEEACALPGVLVVEDASGDHSLAPTGEGFADIQTLHMAEPAASNHLVFTYKMADLGLLPPNTLWIIRFVIDVPPANGHDEYFVAMLTGPDADVHFVYGTNGLSLNAPNEPRQFHPAGSLDSLSNFNADGTITLVLDKSKIAGLEPGAAVYGMIPLTHRITPTDGTEPFTYGYRSASGTVLAYDDASDGFYEIAGNDACAPDKSGILGAGALSLPGLLLMLGGAILGYNRRRRT